MARLPDGTYGDRALTEQIVVRLPDDLYDWIERAADAGERNKAQHIRWVLRRAMEAESDGPPA